ncbi:MAG: hexitol phosphatase HxpB [Bacteroidota bacterium]|jgi:sugar-phosphatase
MILNTVIFDMDGLLIDSEPLWYEAAQESLKQFNVHIEEEAYNTTTGLRTPEFLQHWFNVFDIDVMHLSATEVDILNRVTQKITSKGSMMDGVENAIKIFADAGFKIGLASSSPYSVIDAVLEKIQLKNSFTVVSSAEHLAYGKPHPQVFLDCAAALNSEPTSCICVEDSFNGLIAAKAAKMKCIIVPHPSQYEMDRWNIADLKLKSLRDLEHGFLNKILK